MLLKVLRLRPFRTGAPLRVGRTVRLDMNLLTGSVGSALNRRMVHKGDWKKIRRRFARICNNNGILTVEKTIRGFSPAQYELVNMMSCLHKESDIVELKSVLVQFLNARIQRELDGLYEDGTLSEERMEELSKQHLRTPYRAVP